MKFGLIYSYLIERTGEFTKEKLKACKSLEAYNYYSRQSTIFSHRLTPVTNMMLYTGSGWVQTVLYTVVKSNTTVCSLHEGESQGITESE